MSNNEKQNQLKHLKKFKDSEINWIGCLMLFVINKYLIKKVSKSKNVFFKRL